MTGLNFYFILKKENVPNYCDNKKDTELYFKDVPNGISQTHRNSIANLIVMF